MLPFLKHNKEASGASSSEPIKREHDEDYEYDNLEIAAEDLCHAIEAKNYKAIAEALRAAIEIVDSEPHEEGSHE